MGYSETGTTFYTIEQTEDTGRKKSKDPHVTVRETSINWSLRDVCLGLQMVSISLKNIVSRLNEINGVETEGPHYFRPENGDYAMPWGSSASVASFSTLHHFTDEGIEPWTREELESLMDNVPTDEE